MVMEIRDIPETTPLPKVIKILGEGCNLVANKVYLMAVPLVLDLFLLFGPKLRISDYFTPVFDSAFRQMLSSQNFGKQQLEISIELLRHALNSVNLFGFLQIFPVGVRVLLSSGGAETPLGKSAEIQMTSLLQIIPIIAIAMILGALIGSFYYSLTAAHAAKENGRFSLEKFGSQLLNVILLYIALVVVLTVLAVPAGCLMTFSFMISPILYQIFALILIAVSCWLIIPLFYTPQAIFVKGLDFPHAVKESFQLSSWAGTITIRFILLSLVLSFGLDMIWTIPDQSSWLILFSIFGHAYVATSVLASSFILFREIEKWQSENKSFLEWRKANLRLSQLFKKEPETHE